MKKDIANNGVGFLGLLTLLFIGLKLTRAIDWSWWWVLSPLWMPFALVIVLILVTLIALLISDKLSKDKNE